MAPRRGLGEKRHRLCAALTRSSAGRVREAEAVPAACSRRLAGGQPKKLTPPSWPDFS
eukprot:CAMPEP_0179210982 /NCGR_PEP_ID=MMETSP0797-20121207/108_1 /TAXON_ID=47934 /ORGANISM="Dinophysis acuminata, Strain DAEP01" /LENGTH=57 /DNA_ID=CAMNT_0020916055 /DNA_START=28 /DNA_END=198 /DNA_ORIENTATION=-